MTVAAVDISFEHANAKSSPQRRKLTALLGDHFHPFRSDHRRTTARHGSTSWQVLTLDFIQSQPVQWILFALLILDIISMYIGLYIDAEYPDCHYIERDGVCQQNQPAQCEESKYPGVEKVKVVLDVLSPLILAVFLLENTLLLLILGAREFFGNVAYCLDLGVVLISTILEVASRFMEEQKWADVAGIIILGRLWRMVSLSYDLMSLQVERGEVKHKELQSRIAQLEHLLAANQIAIPPPQQQSIAKMTADDSSRAVYHPIT